MFNIRRFKIFNSAGCWMLRYFSRISCPAGFHPSLELSRPNLLRDPNELVSVVPDNYRAAVLR